MNQMAEIEAAEPDDLDEVDVDDAEQDEGETPDTDDAPEGEAEEGETGLVVTIGDAPPQESEEQAKAPQWVKELRKADRDKARRIRELEAAIAARDGKAEPVELPPKPTLESVDYDRAKYEAEYERWVEQKRAHDDRIASTRAAQEAAQRDWQAKLEGYSKAKASLPVRDYDEAEETLRETFSVTQQGVLVQGAENPALLVYALGKNPAKAKELASINDPVKFAFAVARLETQLKVSDRAKPAPERTVKGAGTLSGTVNSTLEKLRAEADRTGDRTKVAAYIRAQKQKER